MNSDAFLRWFAFWLESQPPKKLIQAVIAIIAKYER